MLTKPPDIDSHTIVHGPNLHPGQLVNVEVVGASGYDRYAQLPKKKGKGLTVLRA